MGLGTRGVGRKGKQQIIISPTEQEKVRGRKCTRTGPFTKGNSSTAGGMAMVRSHTPTAGLRKVNGVKEGTGSRRQGPLPFRMGRRNNKFGILKLETFQIPNLLEGATFD